LQNVKRKERGQGVEGTYKYYQNAQKANIFTTKLWKSQIHKTSLVAAVAEPALDSFNDFKVLI
jgi:hypothetical protein